MNAPVDVLERRSEAETKLGIIDCDIHPYMKSPRAPDAYNIAYGVLEPLLGGNTSRNLDEAAALCSAMNDWQTHEFVELEPRLRGSILVPRDDPEASVKEYREARRRLAGVLYRGPPRAGALDAEPSRQPDPGRRVRGVPETEDRADRGRLRVGAVARLAARCALGEDTRRGTAGEAIPSQLRTLIGLAWPGRARPSLRSSQ